LAGQKSRTASAFASVYNIINNITSIEIRENLISDKDKVLSEEFNYEHSTVMRCHKNNGNYAKIVFVALMDINSETKGNDTTPLMLNL
jgi:hypothetical protein